MGTIKQVHLIYLYCPWHVKILQNPIQKYTERAAIVIFLVQYLHSYVITKLRSFTTLIYINTDTSFSANII